MATTGVDLSRPVDLLDAGKFARLYNVRSIQFGKIESRPGTLAIAPTVGSQIHSIKRLNNTLLNATNPFKLFVGAGTSLYSGTTNFTSIESSFSGNPMSMVSYRPDQSPEAWLYIGDENKLRKVNTDDVIREVGIAPPELPPTPEIGNPIYKVVSECDTAVGWTQSGISGAPTAVSRIPAATTISYILFDAPLSGFGWACISPVDATEDYSWCRPGARVILDAAGVADIVTIEEVFNPITDTTIQSIIYDSGTSGLCCIVLNEPTPGLARNSMVLLDGTEATRVLSVSVGPNGLYSFRCSTTGTFAATDTVLGLPAFRAYTHVPVVATDTITGNVLQFTLTPVGGTTFGTGAITFTGGNDCSLLQTKAVQNNDWMHFSIRADVPGNITDGKILLDIDATTNDFTQNFFYKDIRQNDFQSVASGSLTSLTASQTSIRYNQIESTPTDALSQNIYGAEGYTGYASDTYYDPGPISYQINTGSQQWSELLFRISDLQRVGSDTTRTLKDVQAIRFEFTVTNENASATIIEVDSWWIGGGYGPDVTPGSPTGIQYRYRYRDSRTGAKSMPSPVNRYFVFPERQVINVGVLDSADPQVDSIDVERYDPSLQSPDAPTKWVYVGTVDNVAQDLVDDLVIDQIANNPALETNVMKPFTVLGRPMSGTVNISGTSVDWVSGDQFPPNLLPGTVIILNGVAYQTYGPPFIDIKLQLVNAAVSGTAVHYEIPSPILWGVALPYIFGPLEGATAGYVFGLGDLTNPGYINWMNGNNPDAADDSNFVEVSPPSEPLISGAVWGSTVIVGTDKRLWRLEFTPGSANLFTPTEITTTTGVRFRWGMKAGKDGVYFIGNDGIYKTDGHTVTLASPELWPLFPHDGAPGVITNDSQPINYTYPYHQLCYADGDFYLDFLSDENAWSTWVLSGSTWIEHGYSPTATLHYWEDVPAGEQPRLLITTSDGLVLNSGAATDDNGTPIPCEVWTPAIDNGDSRSLKLFMDCMTDFDGPIDVEFRFNNYQIAGPTDSYSNSGRTQSSTNIAESSLVLYRNIGAAYTFSYPGALYEFQPSYYGQTEGGSSLISTSSFVSHWLDHGIPGWKQLRYRRITLISGSTVVLSIYNDDGVLLDSQAMPSTGSQAKALFDNLANASKGKLLRYTLTSPDDSQFVLFPDESYVRIKKWGGESFLEIKPFV